MTRLVTFKIFESIERANKIMKSNNLESNENYIYLVNIFKNSGLSSYLGYIINLIKYEIEYFNKIDFDNLVEMFKYIKDNGIDVSKLNVYSYPDLCERIEDIKDDNEINRFISKYAPSKIRNDAKNLGDRKLSFLKIKSRLKHLQPSQIELIKKGSRYSNSDEWLDYILNIFKSNEYSLDELKNSNIKIYFEDNEYLIYKPLDYSSYLIPNFLYWCTMSEQMFDHYSKKNLVIFLNKKDITNSYISYIQPPDKYGDIGVEIFNYKNYQIFRELGYYKKSFSDNLYGLEYLKNFRDYFY